MNGRRALVTGGASGIGAATAALLREAGARVAVLDRAEGAELRADVTVPGEVERAVAAAAEALGGPADLLVNAAGVYPVQALLDTEPEDWDRVLAINLRGTFLVARAMVRALGDAPGAIVNLASTAAYRGDTDEPAGGYSATKAAVVALTRQMAAEWGPAVRVNAVAPGLIDTPMLRVMDDRAAGEAYVRDHVPLRRLGRAQDVARAIIFLLSDDASYVTGTTLTVDGGLTAT